MRTPPRAAWVACVAALVAAWAWAAPAHAASGPRVDDAWAADSPLAQEQRIAVVDGVLVVAVTGLDALLADTPCGELRLVLNEQPLAGPPPMQCEAGEVQFALSAIDRAEDPAWRSMAASRPETWVPLGRARVSIAGIGAQALPTRIKGEQALTFELATSRALLAGGLALLSVVLGLGVIGRWTPALRDPRATGPVAARPFSLSRVQLAFWTVLVLGGFLFSSSFNGQAAPVPTSVLALMGVGVGTIAGDSVVDAARSARSRSRGLLHDLIADAHGEVALGRFQAVVWTAVIGGVFIHGVLSTGAVTDLDASLVALMGMTAGAYVGLKAADGDEDEVEPTGD
jgi:hypothetical protein